MFFTTYKHYDIDKTRDKFINEDKNQHISDCVICYESEDREKLKPIKFGRQTKYFKRCRCDIFIHITCLDKWYNIKHTCPICRKYIILNTQKRLFNGWSDIYYVIKKYIEYTIKILVFMIGMYYFLIYCNSVVDIIQIKF